LLVDKSMIAHRSWNGHLLEFDRKHRPNCWMTLMTVAALGAMLACGADLYPAWASLGGSAASISSDAQTLGAVTSASATAGIKSGAANAHATVQSYVLRASTGEKYTYSEFATADNHRVREFVTPDGKVFGVAWQGPRTPDLQALLGSYFAEWRDAVTSQQHQALHRSIVQTSSLVVEMGGPMGFVAGRAWAPELVPAGVNARNVVK
jgi:hypothetical protein